MDYVVAGFGIGAVLALIGFALWELFGNSEEPGQGWLTRASIGLMLGSLVIWAVTGVTLISTLKDSTASQLVMVTTLITILAVLAGSAWYWHADQAMLKSMPQQRVQNPKKATAPAPSAMRPAAGVEVSEWDSWPEREEKATEPAAEPSAPVSFEPEVAAEPQDAAVDTIELESVASAEAPPEDTLIDIAVDAGPVAESEPTTEVAIAGPDEPAAIPDEPEPSTESEEPVAALPANVRAFPTAKPELPAPPAPSEEPVVATTSDEAPVAEPIEPKELAEEIDQPQADTHVNGKQPSAMPEQPAAFESSLLADIDVTSAESDGRYRSPLLADLQQNPDELEGVGLAKWRPEARLTAEDQTAPPPSKSRRKH